MLHDFFLSPLLPLFFSSLFLLICFHLSSSLRFFDFLLPLSLSPSQHALVWVVQNLHVQSIISLFFIAHVSLFIVYLDVRDVLRRMRQNVDLQHLESGQMDHSKASVPCLRADIIVVTTHHPQALYEDVYVNKLKILYLISNSFLTCSQSERKLDLWLILIDLNLSSLFFSSLRLSN